MFFSLHSLLQGYEPFSASKVFTTKNDSVTLSLCMERLEGCVDDKGSQYEMGDVLAGMLRIYHCNIDVEYVHLNIKLLCWF